MTTRAGTQVSAVIMGLLFILPGIVKTVRLNSMLYREMLKTFKNITDVSPLHYLGIKPSPIVYMQSMGVCELILGTTLVVGSRRFKKLACLGIMALMLQTTHHQILLRDFDALIVPCGYFGLLAWLYVSLNRLDSLTHQKSE